MYNSDLTDEQWNILEKYFSRLDPRGTPGKHSRRAIANAIMYVVRTKIRWHLLPADMPPWRTAYNCFWRLNTSGMWTLILKKLAEMTPQEAPQKVENSQEAAPPKAALMSVKPQTYQPKNRRYQKTKSKYNWKDWKPDQV